MATRLNRNHSELVIRRIKTSQLVNRLQDNALGKIEPLSRSQVASATFLIERTLAKAVMPQDINLKGDITVEVVRFADKAPGK